MTILLIIWGTGSVIVLIATLFTVAEEPTTHGQSVLLHMGCALGLFWPLFLAYLIIASPFLAITWWQSRDERR